MQDTFVVAYTAGEKYAFPPETKYKTVLLYYAPREESPGPPEKPCNVSLSSTLPEKSLVPPKKCKQFSF